MVSFVDTPSYSIRKLSHFRIEPPLPTHNVAVASEVLEKLQPGSYLRPEEKQFFPLTELDLD